MISKFPVHVDFLIKHGTIITMDSDMEVVPDEAYAITGSRFAAIGENEVLKAVEQLGVQVGEYDAQRSQGKKSQE